MRQTCVNIVERYERHIRQKRNTNVPNMNGEPIPINIAHQRSDTINASDHGPELVANQASYNCGSSSYPCCVEV